MSLIMLAVFPEENRGRHSRRLIQMYGPLEEVHNLQVNGTYPRTFLNQANYMDSADTWVRHG